MTEPRTEAGRRLFTDNDPMDMLESNGVTWADVVAIEAEALALSEVLVAAEPWVEDYSEAEVYDDETFMTQLDHGHVEYEKRMHVIIALRAALAKASE